MGNFLITTTETYRVLSEHAAQELIDAAKADGTYELVKYNCEHKEKKAKGDVVDDWYRVILTKRFNNELEPENRYDITYEVK